MSEVDEDKVVDEEDVVVSVKENYKDNLDKNIHKVEGDVVEILSK